MTGIWVGRVFGGPHGGGSLTAVATEGPSEDPQITARHLGFPDCAFVQRHEGQSVELRTFSPVEEVGFCVQTSLAAPVALGAAPGEEWLVSHRDGKLSVKMHDAGLVWAQWSGAPLAAAFLRVVAPDWLDWPGVDSLSPLASPRYRLKARLPSVEAVDALTPPDPARVVAFCHRTNCHALVAYAEGDQGGIRLRVFTTSLGGAEDTGTGGAALGLGPLLAAELVAERRILQGPPDPARQGHMLLRPGQSPAVGGRVEPLIAGTLALYSVR